MKSTKMTIENQFYFVKNMHIYDSNNTKLPPGISMLIVTIVTNDIKIGLNGPKR